MTTDAKTEAEAFAKLQEAATRAPWRYCEAGAIVFGPTDNEHIADAVIDIRGYGAGLPMDDNGRFVAHARNTALPRLTLEVVAENERLREDIRQLQDAVKPFADAWHEATTQAAQDDSAEIVYRVNMPVESAIWHKLTLAYARSRVPPEQRPLLAELEQKLGLALQEPSR